MNRLTVILAVLMIAIVALLPRVIAHAENKGKEVKRNRNNEEDAMDLNMDQEWDIPSEITCIPDPWETWYGALV